MNVFFYLAELSLLGLGIVALISFDMWRYRPKYIHCVSCHLLAYTSRPCNDCQQLVCTQCILRTAGSTYRICAPCTTLRRETELYGP